MLAALVVATLLPSCPDPGAWLDGDRQTKDERQENRRRARATWRALGADDTAIDVLDAIVIRESRGDACAVHRLGRRENGLGLGGLAVQFHLSKVAPEAVDALGREALYVPELNAIAMWRIWKNAKHTYRVRSWAEGGEVYAGRIAPHKHNLDRMVRFCRRLRRRGVNCRDPISDLGDGLPRVPGPADLRLVEGLADGA